MLKNVLSQTKSRTVGIVKFQMHTRKKCNEVKELSNTSSIKIECTIYITIKLLMSIKDNNKSQGF